jgi:hypothetical protein
MCLPIICSSRLQPCSAAKRPALAEDQWCCHAIAAGAGGEARARIVDERERLLRIAIEGQREVEGSGSATPQQVGGRCMC